MYSSKHAFLYLHVSKTGGNSIQQVLLPFSEDQKVVRAHQDGVDRFGLSGAVTPSKHAVLAEYEARQPGIAGRNRVVISVRDPFLRALSAYFSPHRWMRPSAEGGFALSAPRWDEADFFAFLDQGRLKPASDWLRLENGLHTPDHVIRFESLPADLDRTVRALGLPGAATLPHVNKSADTGDLRAKLAADATLRAQVLQRYAQDAEVFGYD